MLMDHTRDFFASGAFNPRDVQEPLIFLTRWITHLCAPTFVLLAGISIFLWQQRHTKIQTAQFLLTRGAFLIFLEFTLVKFGWTFSFGTELFLMQVIWMLGLSMILLVAIIYLPYKIILVGSLVMIVSHNLLDSVTATAIGWPKPLWMLLHEQGILMMSADSRLFIVYPIIPWVAVMALGYCLGKLYLQPNDTRIKQLVIMGFGSVLVFIILRFINIYGDPTPWQLQDSIFASLLSFIDAEKYPPSLLYLLMTLGPALLFLALFEKMSFPNKFLGVYGKVPLFFYVTHLMLIHLTVVVVTFFMGKEIDWLFSDPFFKKPKGFGYELGTVYLVSLIIIFMLFPMCVYFRRFKTEKKLHWWSKYI